MAWRDSPVLTRELRRLSRQRRTWVARVAAAAIGFAIIATSQAQHVVGDVAQLALTAHTVMRVLTSLAVMLAVTTVPMGAALAVEEERTDHSLDLLVMTPMTRGEVLWGKVASRLVHTALFLAGVLPVIAMLGTFGAIAPLRLVNLAANVLLLGVLMSQAAAVLVVAQRGGAQLAAIASLLWFMGWSWPAAAGLMAHPDVVISPIHGMARDDLAGLLPLLLCAPIVAAHGWLGPLLFRITTGESDDDELGLLSPEVWTLNRYERWVGAGLPFAATIATAGAVGAAMFDLYVVPLLALTTMLWTWSFAITGLIVLQRITSHMRIAAARARLAAGQQRGIAERRRAVGRWPLLWRIRHTRQGSGSTAVSRTGLVVAALSLVGSMIAVGMGARAGGDFWLLPMSVCWITACVVATVQPLTTTATDRAPRTRELLTLAGQSGRSVFGAHLAAGVLSALPPLAAGTIAMVMLFVAKARYATDAVVTSAEGVVLTMFMASMVLLTAATSTTVGLLARSRSVWSLGIGLAMLHYFGAPVLEELIDLGPLSLVWEVWSPFLAHADNGDDAIPTLVMASAARVALTTGLLILTAWKLDRRR